MGSQHGDKTARSNAKKKPAPQPESKLFVLAGWVAALVIGALTTWAMTAALMWGGLSFMLVAFALPLAVTWFVLPPARTHAWWRWLAVLFVATQTAYPFTVLASTVAIGWLVHRLYLVEFVDHPDNVVVRKLRP